MKQINAEAKTLGPETIPDRVRHMVQDDSRVVQDDKFRFVRAKSESPLVPLINKGEIRSGR